MWAESPHKLDMWTGQICTNENEHFRIEDYGLTARPKSRRGKSFFFVFTLLLLRRYFRHFKVILGLWLDASGYKKE